MNRSRASFHLPYALLGALLLWLGPAIASACDTDMVREYTSIQKQKYKEMLFVVDNCKTPASYIFGTIHLDDKEVKEAAAPAFEMLKTVKHSIFETRSSQKSQQETIALMIMPPTEKRMLSDIIGVPVFNTLSKEVQKKQAGFPIAILERYRPWAASVLVQLPVASTDNIPLDDRLQMEAIKLSLPVIGLETPAQQLDVFVNMTEKEQVSLLLDTLHYISDLRAQNEKLKQLYLAKDLAGIERLGNSAFNEIRDSKMRGYMRHSLINKRNRKMLENMEPYLKSGNSFIAVGALHLPGKNGLLYQLEQKGYFIWPASMVNDQ